VYSTSSKSLAKKTLSLLTLSIIASTVCASDPNYTPCVGTDCMIFITQELTTGVLNGVSGGDDFCNFEASKGYAIYESDEGRNYNSRLKDAYVNHNVRFKALLGGNFASVNGTSYYRPDSGHTLIVIANSRSSGSSVDLGNLAVVLNHPILPGGANANYWLGINPDMGNADNNCYYWTASQWTEQPSGATWNYYGTLGNGNWTGQTDSSGQYTNNGGSWADGQGESTYCGYKYSLACVADAHPKESLQSKAPSKKPALAKKPRNLGSAG